MNATENAAPAHKFVAVKLPCGSVDARQSARHYTHVVAELMHQGYVDDAQQWLDQCIEALAHGTAAELEERRKAASAAYTARFEAHYDAWNAKRPALVLGDASYSNRARDWRDARDAAYKADAEMQRLEKELGAASSLAQRAKSVDAARANVENLRAAVGTWSVRSWHHSYKLAQKAAAAPTQSKLRGRLGVFEVVATGATKKQALEAAKAAPAPKA